MLDLEIVKKMIMQDEEIQKLQKQDKNFHIKKENVLFLYQYIQAKKEKNDFGYTLKLTTQPFLRTYWQKTEKSYQIWLENNLNNQHKVFNHFLNLEKINLKNIIINENSKQEAIDKTKEILSNLDLNHKGFYLGGPFNTGKTYFLKAIAKELMNKKKDFLFMFMPDLVRQFKIHNWDMNILEYKIGLLKNISYLFLDDLGSENMDVEFRDHVLLPILDYRFNNQLPFFISSNFVDFQNLVSYFTLNLKKDFNSEIKAVKLVTKINLATSKYNFFEKLLIKK